ncbi:uncharacterized protein C8Q71DRAFT_761595 [Rhodofomes roseus]|uniref:Uncharacterized protein n=1 Tax=Rhodofomes roseus TaxID=34475 RepID=A0ABQ8KF68_9APHY|nr:uncharacterized protein C8Q71DRAFT_761595 [Rhodofomes roseus]KAH9836283.1 hypothetical protein C8Q71DRAFT_761595 [Rhodofomes roseus]
MVDAQDDTKDVPVSLCPQSATSGRSIPSGHHLESGRDTRNAASVHLRRAQPLTLQRIGSARLQTEQVLLSSSVMPTIIRAHWIDTGSCWVRGMSDRCRVNRCLSGHAHCIRAVWKTRCTSLARHGHHDLRIIAKLLAMYNLPPVSIGGRIPVMWRYMRRTDRVLINSADVYDIYLLCHTEPRRKFPLTMPSRSNDEWTHHLPTSSSSARSPSNGNTANCNMPVRLPPLVLGGRAVTLSHCPTS